MRIRIDPHHADPMDMLAKATLFAKQWSSDAKLRAIDATGVTADGWMDLNPQLCCYAAGISIDCVVGGEQCYLRVVVNSAGEVVGFLFDDTKCGKPRTPR